MSSTCRCLGHKSQCNVKRRSSHNIQSKCVRVKRFALPLLLEALHNSLPLIFTSICNHSIVLIASNLIALPCNPRRNSQIAAMLTTYASTKRVASCSGCSAIPPAKSQLHVEHDHRYRPSLKPHAALGCPVGLLPASFANLCAPVAAHCELPST